MAEISTIQSIIDSIAAPLMMSVDLASPMETVASTASTAVPDDDERPSHSYMDLIVMALLSMPNRQGTLHEIYRFISGKFAFYTKNRKHWKNSVRHNLALHKCFKRLDTDVDQALDLLGVKKPKICPLWSLLWDPAERPDKDCSPRKRNHNQDGPRKRKGGKSSPLTKLKASSILPEDSPCASKPSSIDPVTRISMMLPELGSAGDAVSTSSPSVSTLHLGLVQPPQTPESDYGSLSSAHSPYIPGQSAAAKSTRDSIFEYPACYPSPLDQGCDPRFPPLPLLSVEDIRAVLQCDEISPGSPDSGTGADILEGFGWFDEPAPITQQPYQHRPPCLADSLLDDTHQGTGDFNLQPAEPPAISFFVPKVPVERYLSMHTDFSW